MRKCVWLLLLSILYGCSETGLVEPNPPVVVPPIVKYTITINSDPNVTVNPAGKVVVEKGADLVIAVTPKPGFKAILSIGGDTFPLVGDKYMISNITSNYVVDVTTKEEVVVVPIKTRTDTLSGLGWGLVETKYWYEGQWVIANLSDTQKTDRLYFKADNNYYILNKDGVKDGGGTWQWIGSDSIRIGGVRYKYTLSPKVFTRSERGGTILDRYER